MLATSDTSQRGAVGSLGMGNGGTRTTRCIRLTGSAATAEGSRPRSVRKWWRPSNGLLGRIGDLPHLWISGTPIHGCSIRQTALLTCVQDKHALIVPKTI